MEGCGKENQILHKESNVLGHGWKPSRRRSPAIRHEWNDGACCYKAEAGTEGPEDSQFFVPESSEQECAEYPFRNSQEPGRTADAENGVHPENQGAVADVRNQSLRFVLEPFLISKEEEDDHHRGADQVVIEVSLQKPRFRQQCDERIHGLLLLSR